MSVIGIRRLLGAGVLSVLLVAGLATCNVLIQPLWRFALCSKGQTHLDLAYFIPGLCVVLVAGCAHLLASRRTDLADWGRPLCIVGMLCTGFLVGSFGMVLEPFSAMYAGAGARLSALTSLVMLPGKLYWLVPFACLTFLGAGIALHLRSRWYGWLWCALVVVMLIIQTALYAPIFNFGCSNVGI